MKDKSSNHFNSIKELTPELIKGYVKGTLSPELMVQMERFLDENPFEAEAIEGFENQAVDINNDLAELDLRLSKALNSKQSRNRWSWQIAAAIALLAITGLVLYFYLPPELEQTPVAINEPVQDTYPPDHSDTTEETIVSDIPVEENSKPVPADKLSGVPVPNRQDNQEKDLTEPPFKEEIFDEEVDNIAEQSSDNTVLGISETTPIEKAPATAPLPLESEVFRESIATTSQGDKRQKLATQPASGVVADSEFPVGSQLLSATPPIGWENYVSTHLNYPDSARINKVSGTVELIFQVNSAGQLSDFRIIKGLGYGCDEEAIRVVSDGPAWTPPTVGGNFVNSFGKATIAFPPTD